MPAAAPPTWPPACRDIESPQPRRRGSRYSSWASSTCALPSRDLACWAKMSRISAVRSTTLTRTMSSSARRCDGASSPSTTTVSAPTAATSVASSAALPEPRYVPGSGLARLCRRPSMTCDPAVSASAASSRREISASVTVPEPQTPTRTTFSSRSWRYSTSVTSSSSVDRLATRRSDVRSSSSSWSPSYDEWTVTPACSAVPALASTRATTSSATSCADRVTGVSCVSRVVCCGSFTRFLFSLPAPRVPRASRQQPRHFAAGRSRAALGKVGAVSRARPLLHRPARVRRRAPGPARAPGRPGPRGRDGARHLLPRPRRPGHPGAPRPRARRPLPRATCSTSGAGGGRSRSRSPCRRPPRGCGPSTSTSGRSTWCVATPSGWARRTSPRHDRTTCPTTCGSPRSGPTRRSASARPRCTSCCCAGCHDWRTAGRRSSSSARTSGRTRCSAGSPTQLPVTVERTASAKGFRVLRVS